MNASQTEFPLAVAICAWCKPHERGSGLGALSHGICLRHLRDLKLKTQCLLQRRSPARPVRAARQTEVFLSV